MSQPAERRRIRLEREADPGRHHQEGEGRPEVPAGVEAVRHGRVAARGPQHVLVDLGRRGEVDPPQRGREHEARPSGRPSRRPMVLDEDRRAADRDHDLPEQDDHEEAEPLGQVGGVDPASPGRSAAAAPPGRPRGAARPRPRRRSPSSSRPASCPRAMAHSRYRHGPGTSAETAKSPVDDEVARRQPAPAAGPQVRGERVRGGEHHPGRGQGQREPGRVLDPLP